MFGSPPIALHHDFGQSPLDKAQLPSNVHVVDPWFATGWGIFPVVEANFAALRLLYQVADPDWCVSLSTADYPVKSPTRILADLESTPFDGFLDHRELRVPDLPPGYQRDESLAFNDPGWLEVGYNRYVATDLTPSSLTWRFPRLHKPRLARGPLAERIFTPFTPSFRPFGGDAWYTLNRKAAKILPAQNELYARLRKHFLHRRVPEESIYQTILCNRPDLRISENNLRFTDWSRGGSGPRTLTSQDIPRLITSSAHFARKFPFDQDLFRAVDRDVDRAVEQQHHETQRSDSGTS